MKRGLFIILFLFVTLGFFYSPKYEGVSLLGCGGQQDSQQGCERQTQTIENPAGGYCYTIDRVNEIYGELPSSTSSADLPAAYTYEGLNAVSWKFRVQGNNLKMLLPQINSGGIGIVGSRKVDQEIQPGVSDLSTENCKVFSFNYQREGSITGVNYIIPQSRTDTVNGREVCYYDGSSILSDLIAVGARSVASSEICPDLSAGRPLGSNEHCTDANRRTAQCSVNIPAGEKSIYMAYMEVDGCGNRIVKPAESGRAFTQAELDSGAMRQIAKSWRDSCEEKYLQNKCGNHIVDEGEECDYPVIRMVDSSVKELPVECKEYSSAYSSGFISCPENTCKLDFQECTKDYSGNVQIDVKTDATDSDGVVKKANIYSKIIAQFSVIGTKNNDEFSGIKYVLRAEGADSFEGVYGASLETLYASAPKTASLIFNKGKLGVIGPGVVYSVESDGLTIKNTYTSDLSLQSVLSQASSGAKGDWKYSEIIMELKKRSDGSFDAFVSQKIRNTAYPNAGNIFTGSTQFIITGSESKDVMTELLYRFKSYEEKTQGNTEQINRVPVIDSADLTEKINSGQFVKGVKLKQLNKIVRINPFNPTSDIFINKQVTYTTINISELVRYLSLLQNLLGYLGNSYFIEPNFNFNPGEFA